MDFVFPPMAAPRRSLTPQEHPCSKDARKASATSGYRLRRIFPLLGCLFILASCASQTINNAPGQEAEGGIYYFEYSSENGQVLYSSYYRTNLSPKAPLDLDNLELIDDFPKLIYPISVTKDQLLNTDLVREDLLERGLVRLIDESKASEGERRAQDRARTEASASGPSRRLHLCQQHRTRYPYHPDSGTARPRDLLSGHQITRLFVGFLVPLLAWGPYMQLFDKSTGPAGSWCSLAVTSMPARPR
jgi:hypothetical protein